MADPKRSTAEGDAQATTEDGKPVVVNLTLSQPTNQPAPATPGMDETVPGGRFLVVDEVRADGTVTYREVNAGGEPYDKDHGKNVASAARASRL